MATPKLHHYVPQFYLARFADENGRLWVYDKTAKRVFQTTSQGIAAETYFYKVPEFINTDQDPLFLEKQLSGIESEVAGFMSRWLNELNDMQLGDKMHIPPQERQRFSFYASLQYLRTAEQRDILALFAVEKGGYTSTLSADEKANLHARVLCEVGLVDRIAEGIDNSIWIFGRNRTEMPFFTSDNPMTFKTFNNRMWVKTGVLSKGTYAVFPLSPSIVLYCKERSYWKKIKKFENCLSPVEFTVGLVNQENTGQSFSATRFIISPKNNFEDIQSFIKTIGTDTYAPRRFRKK